MAPLWGLGFRVAPLWGLGVEGLGICGFSFVFVFGPEFGCMMFPVFSCTNEREQQNVYSQKSYGMR